MRETKYFILRSNHKCPAPSYSTSPESSSKATCPLLETAILSAMRLFASCLKKASLGGSTWPSGTSHQSALSTFRLGRALITADSPRGRIFGEKRINQAVNKRPVNVRQKCHSTAPIIGLEGCVTLAGFELDCATHFADKHHYQPLHLRLHLRLHLHLRFSPKTSEIISTHFIQTTYKPPTLLRTRHVALSAPPSHKPAHKHNHDAPAVNSRRHSITNNKGSRGKPHLPPTAGNVRGVVVRRVGRAVELHDQQLPAMRLGAMERGAAVRARQAMLARRAHV